METLQNEIRERALSDAKWRQIQQGLNHSVSVPLRIINLIVVLEQPNLLVLNNDVSFVLVY